MAVTTIPLSDHSKMVSLSSEENFAEFSLIFWPTVSVRN
jgi:hypothetical protein